MHKKRHDSFLSPIELGENPELAALRILKTSLEVARLALLARYPESSEPSERCHSEQEAFAIAILYPIDALEALLDEYVESLYRVGTWPSGEPPKGDTAF